jgi:plasmid replication initiation protein
MLAELSESDYWMLGCTIVACLAAVAGVIIAIVSLNKKQEVALDQPVSVELTKQFVPKHDFDEHVRVTASEFRALRQENREDREKLAVNSSRQIDGVYKRIEDVRKELSEKMDDVPDRVIATLKNTGAI